MFGDIHSKMTLCTLMQSARMRLCSFPDGIEAEYEFSALALARKGYYWDAHTIRCCYNSECITPASNFKNTVKTRIVHSCHSTHVRVHNDIPHSKKGYFYLNYESHRILSFKQKNWPISFIKSEELAACGFLYTGYADCVRCAFCPLRISRWEEGDTAFGEHTRWYPECPFIRGELVGNFTRRAELEKIEGAPFYASKRDMCKLYTYNFYSARITIRVY